MNSITDSMLVEEMTKLLDNLSVWRWLNEPITSWSAVEFSGDERVLSRQLSLQIAHPFFRCLHINYIDTLGEWSYGHDHECSFISYIVTGGYSARVWIPGANGERLHQQLGEHGPGSLVPLADTNKYHSLRTRGPCKSIVLSSARCKPDARKEYPMSGPVVSIRRLPIHVTAQLLSSLVLEFMRVRRLMRQKT